MAAAEGTPQEQAWRLIFRVFLRQRSEFVGIAHEFGLPPQQAYAFLHLEQDVGVPLSELAQVLRCDNSGMTGIADRLEAAGLAERRPHERDRRVKTLRLTEHGVATRRALEARLRVIPDAFAALTDADARTLVAILERAATAQTSASERGGGPA
jgi:DNA-binding MarR family transcriptional regulator